MVFSRFAAPKHVWNSPQIQVVLEVLGQANISEVSDAEILKFWELHNTKKQHFHFWRGGTRQLHPKFLNDILYRFLSSLFFKALKKQSFLHRLGF